MSSSTNVDLLLKVGEVVDKLFDLDEKLMLEWIKSGVIRLCTNPRKILNSSQCFELCSVYLKLPDKIENSKGL